MFVGGPELHAYPNPLRAESGHSVMTITGLVAPSRVRIATLSGETIFDAQEPANDTFAWPAINQSGEPVASGVYLVRVDDAGGQHQLSVMVIR